jgi:small multidrug resistance family-3 protein
LFVAAGFAEIGGGYLVWRWLREGDSWWVDLIGAAVLVGYGSAAVAVGVSVIYFAPRH